MKLPVNQDISTIIKFLTKFIENNYLNKKLVKIETKFKKKNYNKTCS